MENRYIPGQRNGCKLAPMKTMIERSLRFLEIKNRFNFTYTPWNTSFIIEDSSTSTYEHWESNRFLYSRETLRNYHQDIINSLSSINNRLGRIEIQSDYPELGLGVNG